MALYVGGMGARGRPSERRAERLAVPALDGLREAKERPPDRASSVLALMTGVATRHLEDRFGVEPRVRPCYFVTVMDVVKVPIVVAPERTVIVIWTTPTGKFFGVLRFAWKMFWAAS